MRRYVLEITQDGPKVTECSTHINDLHQLFDAFDVRCKDLESEKRAIAEALFGINAGKPVLCTEMVAEILRLQRLASQAEACTNLALNAIEDYETLFQAREGNQEDENDNEENWTDIALNNIAVGVDAERERALQIRGGWRGQEADVNAIQSHITAGIADVKAASSSGFGFPLGGNS